MKPALIALFLLASGLRAQDQHVAWKLSAEPAAVKPGGKVLLRLAGRIDEGWHLYSMSTAAAMPTRLEVAANPAVVSARQFQPAPKRTFDANFNSETETFDGDVTFLVEVTLKPDAPAGPVELALGARYQTCDAKTCVPSKWSGTAAITIDPSAAPAAIAIPAGYTEPKPPSQSAGGSGEAAGSQGLAAFLAVAFGFGLASIFTPCVFPMVPFTVSYFLNNQTGKRSDSLMQATVFCLGIVVLFTGLGLATTAALGPFGIVALGSNPYVNGFIAALFIAFGLSLLGAFEITIPSTVLTALNQSADKGGILGGLLAGLAFSLASFACVGPFVGTILAASVSGGKLRPVLGMLTFATGLALPFFLLALFPAFLQRLPKRGGWMARIKVVMGFVILAASLKYLASLDQVLQLGWITRERFLAAWIVLFAMAALYLLGFLRLEGIERDEPLTLWRLFPGAAFAIFAISLLPGMFGGKLGDLDAFVPLAASDGTAQSGAAGGGETALVWMKNQYREALDRARREGKSVLVTFTGYACTNCHWMKANLFTRPEIAAPMKDFVLVELYTDGTDAVSEANQKVELEKFKTVAIPFYAIMDANENVLATFPGATSKPAEFLAFLNRATTPGAAASDSGARLPAGESSAALPTATRLEGGAYDMRALAGKVAVINFWATWCQPCVREIPGFNQIHQELGPKGVAVLGIAMDEEGAERVTPFLKKHEMRYPVALGAAELNGKFNLEQLPVTLVFDKAGRLMKRFEGFIAEADLRAAIAKAQ